MKLEELFETSLIAPNRSDRKAVEMGLPNAYRDKGAGGRKKARREKITVKDTKTGTVYGRRTIFQKRT